MADILEELDINAELTIALAADPQYLIDMAIIWPCLSTISISCDEHICFCRSYKYSVTKYLGKYWTPTDYALRIYGRGVVMFYNGYVSYMLHHFNRDVITDFTNVSIKNMGYSTISPKWEKIDKKEDEKLSWLEYLILMLLNLMGVIS